jgi:hypothetical protein
LQAHLNAAQADALSKLLNELAKKHIGTNFPLSRQHPVNQYIKISTSYNTDNMGKLFVMVFAFAPAPKTNS